LDVRFGEDSIAVSIFGSGAKEPVSTLFDDVDCFADLQLQAVLALVFEIENR